MSLYSEYIFFLLGDYRSPFRSTTSSAASVTSKRPPLPNRCSSADRSMVLGSSINMQRSTSVERGGCYAGKPPMVPPTLDTTMASTPAGSISASPHHNSHVHVIGFNQHDNNENNQRTIIKSQLFLSRKKILYFYL